MRLFKITASWFLISFTLLLTFSNLKAQQRIAWYNPEYVTTIWDNKNGLPQNTVFDIQKDENGFLWVATEEGLTRFDGKDFVIYNNTNLPNISTNSIYDLTPAATGGIWAASDHSVIRVKKNEVWVQNISKFSQNTWITCLTEDSKNRLWIGTNAGDLYQLKNGKVTKLGVWPYQGIKSIQVLRSYKDGILIGTDAGLYAVTNNLKNVNAVAGFENLYIRTLAVAPDNSIWIGTKANGLFHKTEKQTINFTEKQGLPELFITAIRVGTAGDIWVGTNSSGVHQLQNGTFKTIKTPGLPTDGVRSIFFTDPDLMWLGTGASGLIQVKPARVKMLSPTYKLASNIILPIYQHQNGDVWVGTAGSGLNRITKSNVYTYTRAQGLTSDLILTIGGTRDAVFIGTPDGLNQFNLKTDKIEKKYTVKDGLANNVVLSVYADLQNTTWIGTRSGGLHTLSLAGKITRIPVPALLASTEFTAIFEDNQHNKWFGTRGAGILKISATGQLKHYSATQLPAAEITCAYQDPAGTMWFGTEEGLMFLTGNQFKLLNKTNGLNSNIVLAIIADGKNGVWLSSNYGLQQIAISELARIRKSTDKKIQINVQAFNTADGMRNSEANGGIFPAGYRMQDSTLWFPTVDGIAIIDPAGVIKNEKPVNIFIKALRYGDINQDIAQDITVPPGVANIEIDYTSVDFIKPTSINFYYRLKGIQKDWQFADERRTAYFTSLEPGNYTFEVKAEQNGKWSETASLGFTIEPFFNQTLWFKGSLIFLLFLAGFFARTFYVQNRQETELKALVEARTKDLRESNDRFQLINKATSDVIWDLNIERDEIYWGENLENLFGHTRQDGLEKNNTLWEDNLHPDDAERVFSTYNAALNGTATKWQAEYRFRKANQQYAQVINRGYILRNEQGKAIRILGAMQDVTRLKEEEQQLKLLESVITNSSDGVVITETHLDEPGPRIIYVNEAFSKITGYRKDELIGNSPRMLQGPRTDKKELHKLKLALQKGETCEIEIINYRKTGEPYFANMNISPVSDQQGNLTHFISIERDFTERREYLKAIESQNARLREIAWIQSHIVRAPLARILGLINLLQKDNDISLNPQEIYGHIISSAQELDTVIKDIVRKSENIDNAGSKSV